MFQRFTERARQVVVFAQDQARWLRHNSIGTEHLLLGLAREGTGVGARIVVDIAESEEVCDMIVARLGATPHPSTQRRTRRWRIRR